MTNVSKTEPAATPSAVGPNARAAVPQRSAASPESTMTTLGLRLALVVALDDHAGRTVIRCSASSRAK